MNKYMEKANELSKKGIEHGEGGPFGAVIVKGDQIVGVGNNKVIKNNDPTAHAEILAIRDAANNLKTHDLSGCEIYTTCYPCPMCLSAIIWANIKTIYYGNTQQDAANIGFRDDFIYQIIDKINNNKDVSNDVAFFQLDRDETIITFKKFQENTNLSIY